MINYLVIPKNLTFSTRGARQLWVFFSVSKKQNPHLPTAYNTCDLSESEERQEQDKAHGTDRQETLRIPSKRRRNAIRDGMSMPNSPQRHSPRCERRSALR